MESPAHDSHRPVACHRAASRWPLNAGRHATIAQIADIYRISRAHLTKVVHQFGVGGETETVRGRNGGLRLKLRAAQTLATQINIGAVARRTESDLDLVPCFGDAGTCVISGACMLQLALHEALAAFLGVLDWTTLSDLVAPPRQLTAMLGIAPPPRSRRTAVGLAS